MNTFKCPHCDEILPPVSDAFCSFCRGCLNEPAELPLLEYASTPTEPIVEPAQQLPTYCKAEIVPVFTPFYKVIYTILGAFQVFGGLIVLLGVLILIGNITGMFTTFSYAGFITMTIGSLLCAVMESGQNHLVQKKSTHSSCV